MNIHMGYKLLLSIIINCMISVPVVACDMSCQKASKRAVLQYGNKVEQAEDKSCKVKVKSVRSYKTTASMCKKAIRYLNVKFEGYSDLIKSNPEIVSLRARHLKLNDTLFYIEKLALAAEAKEMTSNSKLPFGLDKVF